MMAHFDIELSIDLSCAGGIFADDIAAIVTIHYEVEHYRSGGVIKTIINGWDPIDIRFPGVPSAVTAKDYLWPMFHEAVDRQRAFIEAAIRNREDAVDVARRLTAPLLGIAAE